MTCRCSIVRMRSSSSNSSRQRNLGRKGSSRCCSILPISCSTGALCVAAPTGPSSLSRCRTSQQVASQTHSKCMLHPSTACLPWCFAGAWHGSSKQHIKRIQCHSPPSSRVLVPRHLNSMMAKDSSVTSIRLTHGVVYLPHAGNSNQATPVPNQLSECMLRPPTSLHLNRKRNQTLRSTGSTGRSSLRTPEPVPGRRHAELQTEQYLEELADVVPEADGATQTDAFLDRPSTPLFVPPMTGTDAATQIENGALLRCCCAAMLSFKLWPSAPLAAPRSQSRFTISTELPPPWSRCYMVAHVISPELCCCHVLSRRAV